jgi:hypothetical protein
MRFSCWDVAVTSCTIVAPETVIAQAPAPSLSAANVQMAVSVATRHPDLCNGRDGNFPGLDMELVDIFEKQPWTSEKDWTFLINQ